MKECPKCKNWSYEHNSSTRRYQCYICGKKETLGEKRIDVRNHKLKELGLL